MGPWSYLVVKARFCGLSNGREHWQIDVDLTGTGRRGRCVNFRVVLGTRYLLGRGPVGDATPYSGRQEVLTRRCSRARVLPKWLDKRCEVQRLLCRFCEFRADSSPELEEDRRC